MDHLRATVAAFFLLACSGAAVGQGRTVVSGTVTGSDGLAYVGGSVSMTLSLPVGASGAILNGAQVNGTVGPLALDANGAFLVQLADNTLVQCANAAGQIIACAPQTQWTFAVTLSPGMAPPLGTGPQTCSSTVTISGSSQTVALSCPAVSKLVSGTTGSGTSGGTGTPSNQAGGSCLSTALPGQFCAGPVPTLNGSNPSFEQAFSNSAQSASTLTISGAPLVSASTAIWASVNDVAGPVTSIAPGFTAITGANVNNTQLLKQTVSSIAQISPTMGYTATTNIWGSLFFVGGNVNTAPVQSANTGTVTCATGANCAQVTMGSPVSASNILVMVGRFTGTNIQQTVSVADNLGNAWQKISSGVTLPATPGVSGAVWIVQQPIAGTPTITLTAQEAGTIIGTCCQIYELSGAAPYFTGSTGPTTMRYITPQDLAVAGIGVTGLAYGRSTLSVNATVGNTATAVLTVTLRTPSVGCPCRADVRYSGWANFTGVTNEPDIDFWVSDGTNKFAPFTSGQSNAANGAETTVHGSELSPVTYANGVSVTFTLFGIVSSAVAGTQQFSYQAAQPTGGSGANSYLDVAFVASR